MPGGWRAGDRPSARLDWRPGLKAIPWKAAALVLVVACLRGCGAGQAFKHGRAGRAGRRLGRRPSATTSRPSRPTRMRPSTKIALERAKLAASRVHLDEGRRARGEGRPRGRHRRVPAGGRVRPGQPPRGTPRPPTSSRRCATAIEAARPKPQIEQMKERARQAAAGAAAQPGVAPAARHQVRGRPPGEADPRLPGAGAAASTCMFEATFNEQATTQVRDRSRRRDARTGAQPGDDLQQAVLQGAEPEDDPDHPGQPAEPHEVRRPGHPDVPLSHADATELHDAAQRPS